MAKKRAAQNNENVLPIRDLIFHCLAKWYWFVITIGISLGLAVLYILSTPPVYQRHTEILIKEESDKRGSNQGLQNFASSQSSANAEEEMKILRSPGIMRKVVERLNLDVEYRGNGNFFDGIIYKLRPVKLTALDLRESDDATMSATVTSDGKVKLESFTLNGKELKEKAIITALGDTIETPLGKITITGTEYFNAKDLADVKFTVHKRNIDAVVNEFCGNLTAGLANEETSIVRISIKDISTVRAEDILNAIIGIYNEQWMAENNKNAIKTSDFIRSRAEELKIELFKLDKEIAQYSNDRRITSSTASELVSSVTNNEDAEKVQKLNSQLEFARFMLEYMQKSNNRENIPNGSGIEIAGLDELISLYNASLLERNRLATNSSENHPIVVEHDKNLEELHQTIQNALSDYVTKLRKDIAISERREKKEIAKISRNAADVKAMLSLKRQQKVKEALYLFLLQKLEETELSKEFTASNNRVLVPPSGSNTPIEPMQKQSITLALIIGILLPTSIIFIREITNRKVRGRKDLENINIPYVGEIPLYGKIEKNGKSKREIVVQNGNRNVINEAFRVLRTNIEFMIRKGEDATVLGITSFNPGSGKTYLTMNIGASLAVKGAKVLVIDGDMRHGSSSEYVGSPETGLSDYLSSGINDIDKIVTPVDGYKAYDIIAIGSTPPNPTELLHSDRFKTLIDEMRKKYDYILIDCPPIDIVADTQIIEEYIDRTLFVIRAGLLDREMLNKLEEIYETKRLKNLAMILNGTHAGQNRYGYRYGYSYSYGYGYGYGYGYHQKK